MSSLRLDHVSKRYLIRQAHVGPAPNGLVARLRQRFAPAHVFWALRDVSFEVARGEAVGIIGPNGAGKSTLLKLLAGITAPTVGEISISGKLSALLEVGSGFHPELTGIENIYLSGSILGMQRKEISAKLDGIIDFAGVRPFIDVPVKRFSSGMVVRLGFSVAAHLDPDILLLDEVLAVGDAAFQKKCIDRVLELKRRSTVVFISHDLAAVQQLCDRVIVMNQGEIVYDGATAGAMTAYSALARFRASPPPRSEAVAKTAEVVSLEFLDRGGAPVQVVKTGDALRIRVEYRARIPVAEVNFSVFFYGADGTLHCQFTTWLSGETADLEPGNGIVEFTCEELGLQPGSYLIDAIIEQHGNNLDWQYRCSTIQVNSGRNVKGLFYHPHTWRETRASSILSGENVTADPGNHV
ncbi:MAG TPA: ABC transporter ATP-binding protein [Bryobacteraceae bacterium]|jgi:lipopolysaccharide transport system ATP-binding protein|nr:ABC transporter ATP-binding protein [Bryobacteraceae bacterium]